MEKTCSRCLALKPTTEFNLCIEKDGSKTGNCQDKKGIKIIDFRREAA